VSRVERAFEASVGVEWEEQVVPFVGVDGQYGGICAAASYQLELRGLPSKYLSRPSLKLSAAQRVASLAEVACADAGRPPL